MAGLVVGPLLRYVDQTSATIWVETDAPSEVAVDLDGSPPSTGATFTVHGHHYALVELTGLRPGSDSTYQVRVDGQRVWPEPDSDLPPSRIRTLEPGRPLRLAFGSCRMSVPHDAPHNRTYGVDVLRAYAHRMAEVSASEWPDQLLLLGDQVYADETSEAMQDFIRTRRDVSTPPGTEVADFEEYTELYRLAWSDPWNRWLLSTLPSLMIFDDHDVRDDWNTSSAWRQEMNAQPWWRARITGGLGAYWLYQHLGNLSPADRAADPLFAKLHESDGDVGDVLDDFAWSADQEPSRNRWSYARDFGGVLLVMLDSRCGRVLDGDRRELLGAETLAWFDEQVRRDVDHLLIGTSLPYLLPTGLHHVESWNEAVAAGAWGGRMARLGERIRQGVDLEHWAAFRNTFDTMARAVRAIATGAHGTTSPATVTFLSGDVHYSYGARAHYRGEGATTSRVHQLVCSPIRNPLSPSMRYANVVASFGVARLVGRGLAAAARLPGPELDWTTSTGPKFDNALATVELSGREARVRWETAKAGLTGAEKTELRQIESTDL